ncbi:flagellar hook-associated protein FlgK [Pontibacillus sp. HMF3514]|uniref:flagellar hook-associated protein FlgK n=1 Tax=Pontibacillus sp. HMF3514 TaxID=2692425 RepID=UPI0013200B57|nr:flagellar hook-associated protein FlgK [Pontibacillus sp. HMF3514]QHE53598.1 flagellar hook-associated protein FlgK [Pontibacillus sp. HMF3514]
MSSTFNGLEVAKRALFTQQSALQTTGHNISNANTPGYSRQRVNFEQTAPFPPSSRNRPEIPGQVGSGVQAGSVQRVREEFLDVQFRGENSKQGYFDSLTNAINKMEEIMNEPTEQGLSKTMDRFSNALQDLSDNPQDAGARSVVRQRGASVAETFNYISNSLSTIQKDLKNETNVTVKDINSTLTQIKNLNKQIGEIEPNGYLPNDLYDERDRLIDDLSNMVNVDVSYTSNGGKAMAQGQVSIQLADETGKPMSPQVSLLDGENMNKVGVTYNETMGQTLVDEIQVGGQSFSFDEFESQGKLKGLVRSMGYMGDKPQVEAFSVSTSFSKVDDITASDLDAGSTITIKGTSTVDDGDPPYEQGETATITIEDGMSLQDLTDAINNETENTGVVAEIVPATGEPGADVTPKRLVLKTEHVGKEASLSVSGTAAKSLGIQGETDGSNEAKGIYADMLQNLDDMAFAFTEEFNRAHREGYNLKNLEDNENPKTPNFFTLGQGSYEGIGAANSMSISKEIQQSTDNIAAAQEAEGEGRAYIGNGDNARDLANVRNVSLEELGKKTSVSSFYESIIGDMGVQSQEFRRLEDNSSTLKQSVEERRQSVSGVSLDEEMSNMIKFQHAYNAAARNMTTVDEMLDKIINGMGRVGR